MEEKKVENLKKEIKELESDINEIQSSCAHENIKITFNQDTKEVEKVCKDCDKKIGYPTDEELKYIATRCRSVFCTM